MSVQDKFAGYKVPYDFEDHCWRAPYKDGPEKQACAGRLFETWEEASDHFIKQTQGRMAFLQKLMDDFQNQPKDQ